jgi:uncharacterized protein YeaO (DUF488 family)
VLLVHGDDDRNVRSSKPLIWSKNCAPKRRVRGRQIHDLLRWNDWLRAYHATAEFLDCKLASSGERQ